MTIEGIEILVSIVLVLMVAVLVAVSVFYLYYKRTKLNITNFGVLSITFDFNKEFVTIIDYSKQRDKESNDYESISTNNQEILNFEDFLKTFYPNDIRGEIFIQEMRAFLVDKNITKTSTFKYKIQNRSFELLRINKENVKTEKFKITLGEYFDRKIIGQCDRLPFNSDLSSLFSYKTKFITTSEIPNYILSNFDINNNGGYLVKLTSNKDVLLSSINSWKMSESNLLVLTSYLNSLGYNTLISDAYDIFVFFPERKINSNDVYTNIKRIIENIEQRKSKGIGIIKNLDLKIDYAKISSFHKDAIYRVYSYLLYSSSFEKLTKARKIQKINTDFNKYFKLALETTQKKTIKKTSFLPDNYKYNYTKLSLDINKERLSFMQMYCPTLMKDYIKLINNKVVKLPEFTNKKFIVEVPISSIIDEIISKNKVECKFNIMPIVSEQGLILANSLKQTYHDSFDVTNLQFIYVVNANMDLKLLGKFIKVIKPRSLIFTSEVSDKSNLDVNYAIELSKLVNYAINNEIKLFNN